MNSNPYGPVLTGNPVQRNFPTEGSYFVTVVASDGVAKSAGFQRITVTLSPNPGTVAQNIFNDGGSTDTVVNPLNNLGIKVSTSKGDALHFDTVGAAGAGETYTFKVNGQVTDPNDLKSINTAALFHTDSINVMELTAVQGNVTRTARLMVPVGKPETDPSSALPDLRSPKGKQPLSYKVGGKLSQKSLCSVAFSCVVELSAGLSLADMSDISFGLSNLHTSIKVDSKGRLLIPADDPHFKNIKVTMPRKLDRTTKKTLPSSTMTIAFTVAGTASELTNLALGTEGIMPQSVTSKGTPIPRQLQYGAKIAGMTYQSQISVLYTPNTDYGTISARH